MDLHATICKHDKTLPRHSADIMRQDSTLLQSKAPQAIEQDEQTLEWGDVYDTNIFPTWSFHLCSLKNRETIYHNSKKYI